jgi:hypothetical protein
LAEQPQQFERAQILLVDRIHARNLAGNQTAAKLKINVSGFVDMNWPFPGTAVRGGVSCVESMILLRAAFRLRRFSREL